MSGWSPADLSAWRHRLRLTQSQAAAALEYHLFHYKNMEYGKRPVLERTKALCDYVEFEFVQGSSAKGVRRHAKGVCITAQPILDRLGFLQRIGSLLAAGGRPKLRYLSLFSGLESATAAFERLGGEEAIPIAFCDNAPQSQAVLNYRWPDVPIIHDVSVFNFKPLRGHVDLVVAGPPCQSFSSAGKRRGLDDPRGSLTLHAMRAIAVLQPRFVVIENVPGLRTSNGGEGFRAICETFEKLGFAFAWRELDAQYFGLAQARRRLWVVGERARDATGPAAILDLGEGLGGRPLARGTRWSAASRRAEAADKWVEPHVDWSDPLLWQKACPEDDAAAAEAAAGVATHVKAAPYDAAVAVNCRNMTSSSEIAPCLQTKSNSLNSNPIVVTVRAGEVVARKLTPVECLRLQGIDDDWLDGPLLSGKPLSDQSRILLTGNAWAVPCAAWVFAGILAIHRGDRSHVAQQGWARHVTPDYLKAPSSGTAAGGDGRELREIIADGPRSFGGVADVLAGQLQQEPRQRRRLLATTSSVAGSGAPRSSAAASSASVPGPSGKPEVGGLLAADR